MIDVPQCGEKVPLKAKTTRLVLVSFCVGKGTLRGDCGKFVACEFPVIKVHYL
jgi:hypothetical protein